MDNLQRATKKFLTFFTYMTRNFDYLTRSPCGLSLFIKGFTSVNKCDLYHLYSKRRLTIRCKGRIVSN